VIGRVCDGKKERVCSGKLSYEEIRERRLFFYRQNKMYFLFWVPQPKLSSEYSSYDLSSTCIQVRHLASRLAAGGLNQYVYQPAMLYYQVFKYALFTVVEQRREDMLHC